MLLLCLREIAELEIHPIDVVLVDPPVNLSKRETAGFRLCSSGAVPLDCSTRELPHFLRSLAQRAHAGEPARSRVILGNQRARTARFRALLENGHGTGALV